MAAKRRIRMNSATSPGAPAVACSCLPTCCPVQALPRLLWGSIEPRDETSLQMDGAVISRWQPGLLKDADAGVITGFYRERAAPACDQGRLFPVKQRLPKKAGQTGGMDSSFRAIQHIQVQARTLFHGWDRGIQTVGFASSGMRRAPSSFLPTLSSRPCS